MASPPSNVALFTILLNLSLYTSGGSYLNVKLIDDIAFQPFRGAWGLGKHSGIDIADPYGNTGREITPFANGTVIKIKDIDDIACGKYVVLDHGYNVTSWYCHLDSIGNISVGDFIEPGQVIGYMGNTGASTGPHLHFMIKVYDIPVNPRNFVSGEPSQ